MKLISPTFANRGSILPLCTCDGKNISPPLQWETVPNDAKFLFLICDDPDAPKIIWDHWIIFNLSVQINSLPEGIDQFPSKTKLGKNSWGKVNYGGALARRIKNIAIFLGYMLWILF